MLNIKTCSVIIGTPEFDNFVSFIFHYHGLSKENIMSNLTSPKTNNSELCGIHLGHFVYYDMILLELKTEYLPKKKKYDMTLHREEACLQAV